MSSTLPYGTTSSGGAKAPRRGSGKATHSRSYPRGVGLDFRKIAGMTLLSYIDHHGTYVLPGFLGVSELTVVSNLQLFI